MKWSFHKAFFGGTEFYLWKTSKTAALTDTQREQCKEPQPQEPVESVTETNELPSKSAVEVVPEVPPPTPPTRKMFQPRRSSQKINVEEYRGSFTPEKGK